MRTAIALAIAAGLLVISTCSYSGGNPTPPPPTMPAPTDITVRWCTPVAVPLYTNGTDCQ